MASYFPNGTIFSISTTRGSPVTITSISNANPGVAAATAHGLTDGDILILNPASTRLSNRVARVASSDTNSFAIEGIDTSNTSLYPSGFGAGTAVAVDDFVPLSQITGSDSTGGEQQYFEWTYLEDGQQRRRKTFKNAKGKELTLDWDPDLPWHAAMLQADQDSVTRVLRAELPSGDVMYWSVEVAYDGEPTTTANQNMQTTAAFALQSPYHTRYAAA